jgi:hypothetical protein
LFVDPVVDVRECRTEDERHDSLRTGEDVLEREHSAPRRPEQMDALETQLLAHRDDFLAEDVDRPIDVARMI